MMVIALCEQGRIAEGRPLREQFLASGGEQFATLSCLNAGEASIDMLETLVRRVCRLAGVTPEEVAGSGRRAAVTRTRDGIAHLCRRTSGTHSTDLVRGPAPCLVGGVHRAVWGALSVEVSCEDLGRELPGPVLAPYSLLDLENDILQLLGP